MNNELIKIENKDGEMVVSSREVANNFEKRHADVLEKIVNLINEIQPTENFARYFIPNEYCDLKGEMRKEYLLTRDGFSLLVMGFNGVKALQWKLKYIEAFNEMEKVIKQNLPTTYKDALKQLLEKEEAREKLQLAYEEMKSKAIFADAVETSTTSVLIGDLAKLIKQNGYDIGQNRLFQWLRDNNYLIKSGERKNMPTQTSMDMGLFEVKERTVIDPNGSNRITRTTKVTGKGQIYFINKFNKGLC